MKLGANYLREIGHRCTLYISSAKCYAIILNLGTTHSPCQPDDVKIHHNDSEIVWQSRSLGFAVISDVTTSANQTTVEMSVDIDTEKT